MVSSVRDEDSVGVNVIVGCSLSVKCCPLAMHDSLSRS
jgi:hypothetical protein